MIREFRDINLCERNSFHIDQSAERVIEFNSVEDLSSLFSNNKPEKWYVLSGGNNIIFTRDFDGTLLTPVAQSITLVKEDAVSATIKADAGVEWDDLVEWAVQRNLWGIENLSLIPGKVGAAPVQNIGAYGREVKDVIKSVEMFCVDTLNTLVLAGDHCDFGYRESIFKHALKGRVIITSVTIKLSKRAVPKLDYGDVMREVEARGGVSLRNIREAICSIRRKKLPDPAIQGNAGSFFKNPIVEMSLAEKLKSEYPDMPVYPAPNEPSKAKLAAGWLIDRAGMKGYKENNVGVHDKQALVLVNLGGATGSEVMAFARKVQSTVEEKFGVMIDTEVNII